MLLETFKTSQHLLQTQRFNFPPEWMWLANIEGEWDAFQQILKRKWEEMETKVPTLQKRILDEDRTLEALIRETEADWKNARNDKLMRSTDPTEALRTLDAFEQRLRRLQTDYLRIVRALDALDLNAPADNKIEPLLKGSSYNR